MDTVPTEAEINVYDSLDEQSAVRDLLGLTREQARKQFEDNMMGAGESLMHIGPVACAYYGMAAIDAAWNCARNGDEGEALDYVLMVLKNRCETSKWDVGEQSGFTEAVLSLCERVEVEYDSLNVDEVFHGRLRLGYRDLREKLGGKPATATEPNPPVAPGLPSEADINVTDSFDEREAVRTFLGLTFAEAEALFAEDTFHARSLLADMGPKAFAFYLPAAIAAAKSPDTKGITESPSSGLLFHIGFRARRKWQLHQMLPLTLDEGMLERLPELIALCEFAEAEPPFQSPYGFTSHAQIPPPPRRSPNHEDPPDYDAMFRMELEGVRDQLPRPALLADGSFPDFPTSAFSLDAMVFVPDAAPTERAGFLDWYSEVTRWQQGRGYGDSAVCDARLQSWLVGMVAEIAPIAGPLARPENDVTRNADFCCDETFIYFTASPHDPEPVWGLALDLAARNELGLFFVAGEAGELYRPDGEGGLALVSTNA